MEHPLTRSASIVLAAGRGTRMTGYDGNKTLLPLVPGPARYQGTRPLIVEVLENLPAGPKAVVVHHCRDRVTDRIRDYAATPVLQERLDGTGGALLAARAFLESVDELGVLITMGDVPLIAPSTYLRLLQGLARHALMVLAFAPPDPGQYGRLEMDGDRVRRIVEWKYWKDFPDQRKARLKWCNAGVYAATRQALLRFIPELEARPHEVRKQRGADWVTFNEYFLTDVVELMSEKGLPAGVVEAEEEEVIGVDTPEALDRVQAIYARGGNRPET